MKIEVLTVNYNTPELVKQLIVNTHKHIKKYYFAFTIINNGPLDFTETELFNIIDFHKEAEDFIKELRTKNTIKLRNSNSVYGSAHHAFTIDNYIYNRTDADIILLFDTDVIINEDFDDKIDFLINSDQPFYSCITPEDIGGTLKPRVAPHCCFINRKKFIEMNLKFLTEDKFLDITHQMCYDAGRGLYENVAKYNYVYFKDNSFFRHLKGVSWKKLEHRG